MTRKFWSFWRWGGVGSPNFPTWDCNLWFLRRLKTNPDFNLWFLRWMKWNVNFDLWFHWWFRWNPYLNFKIALTKDKNFWLVFNNSSLLWDCLRLVFHSNRLTWLCSVWKCDMFRLFSFVILKAEKRIIENEYLSQDSHQRELCLRINKRRTWLWNSSQSLHYATWCGNN